MEGGKIATSLSTECVELYGHMLSPRITFTSNTTSRTSTGPSLLICPASSEIHTTAEPRCGDCVCIYHCRSRNPRENDTSTGQGKGTLTSQGDNESWSPHDETLACQSPSSPGEGGAGERLSKGWNRTACFTDDTLHIHALCAHYLPLERMCH